MLVTFTPQRCAAALNAVTDHRQHLGDRASRGLCVLQERLGDLGRGIVDLTEVQRDLLTQALLRHPSACQSPTGCEHDAPIGELLYLLVAPPLSRRVHDPAAVAVVGRLYYLAIGEAHLIGECLSVSGQPEGGGELAYLRVWTTVVCKGAPVSSRHVTVSSWCLAEVMPTP